MNKRAAVISATRRGLTFVFAKGGRHRGHGCIICLLWKPGILSSLGGQGERLTAFHTLSRVKRASAGWILVCVRVSQVTRAACWVSSSSSLLRFRTRASETSVDRSRGGRCRSPMSYLAELQLFPGCSDCVLRPISDAPRERRR